MTAFKDLSHLPAPTEAEGLLPDSDSTFVTVLVDELAKQPSKPQVSDTLTRHSSTASCLKRVALLRDGVEPEPMDLAGHHVTHIGTLVHEAWQSALGRYCDERKMSYSFEAPSTLEDLTSGSADAFLWENHPTQDRLIKHVLELKTVAGTSYEYMVGLKGPAQGPKTSHMYQLALNVMGLDADKGSLVYLSRDSISAGKAQRAGISEPLRIGAAWSFDRSQLQPMADEWLTALRFIRDNPTEKVPRWVMGEMPKGARLNPETGTWTLERDGQVLDTGEYWFKGAGCKDYCPVAEECRKRYAEGE